MDDICSNEVNEMFDKLRRGFDVFRNLTSTVNVRNGEFLSKQSNYFDIKFKVEVSFKDKNHLKIFNTIEREKVGQLLNLNGYFLS